MAQMNKLPVVARELLGACSPVLCCIRGWQTKAGPTTRQPAPPALCQSELHMNVYITATLLGPLSELLTCTNGGGYCKTSRISNGASAKGKDPNELYRRTNLKAMLEVASRITTLVLDNFDAAGAVSLLSQFTSAPLTSLSIHLTPLDDLHSRLPPFLAALTNLRHLSLRWVADLDTQALLAQARLHPLLDHRQLHLNFRLVPPYSSPPPRRRCF